MAKTNDEIRQVIDAFGTVLSEQERLDNLLNAYDRVVEAIHDGHGTVVIEIRQRQHRVSDPAMLLPVLREEIEKQRDRVLAKKKGAPAELTPQGEALKVEYTKQREKLQGQLVDALPKILRQ